MSLIILAIIAAVASQIIGAIWHMPLFGKKWGMAMGMTEAQMATMKPSMKDMSIRLALNYVANFLMAFATYLILANFGAGTIPQVLIITAVIFVGFAFPFILIGTLWNGRPVKSEITTFLISIGYQFINFIVWALLFAWLAR
jgi:fatty acid desaturase